MCGQISSVTATSAEPAAPTKRTEFVDQRLVGADLNQRRRKSAQAGIKRRHARIFSVEALRQIGARQLFEIIFVDERIDRVLGRKACARHGQVGPRRYEPRASRLLFAGRAQVIDQRGREPAAGTVAADRDLRRRDALRLQKAPGGQRIVKRGGERMLRGQAIRDGERADARRPARLAHQPAVAAQRARAIAAAVKEEQHAPLLAPGHDRPLARDAAEIDAGKLNIGGDRPDRADFVDPRPPFGPTLRPRLGTQQCPDDADLARGHRSPFAMMLSRQPA